MKRLALIFLVMVIVVVGLSYMYLNYKIHLDSSKRENMKFESYYQKEINGLELATIINKAVDNNVKNDVEKDKKGKYINNENNSINIDVKMIDNNKTYDMETLYAGKMDEFAKYYGQIKFKCIDIQYHKATKKIKYMLFEQITQ